MGLSIKQGKADLAKHDTPRVIPICNAAGHVIEDAQGNPAVTWSILGVYSKRYQEIRDRLFQRNLKGKKQKKPTAQDVRRNQIELVAGCVTDWTGMDDDNGQPLPCTRENAEHVLRELPNVLDQMLEEQGDAEGFSENASTS